MSGPRYQCLRFISEYTNTATLEIDKSRFDELCRAKAFADGPHQDTFGDGPGEPYNPHCQAFGLIECGREHGFDHERIIVYTEIDQ